MNQTSAANILTRKPYALNVVLALHSSRTSLYRKTYNQLSTFQLCSNELIDSAFCIKFLPKNIYQMQQILQ